MRTLVQAQQQLWTNGGAELSWHFRIVSFDSEYETPEVLRAYGATYRVAPPLDVGHRDTRRCDRPDRTVRSDLLARGG